ncbi:MAG: sigma-70 family RNA polymerase sigma factor [Actinobacteria bacterium]|nr:sigma-70 family RNA polymerase sigma factor [Actinomycetota bacterium]
MTTARATGATARRMRRRELDPLDSYRHASDEVLVASASAGDGAAFNALIERYGSMIRSVCRRRLRNEHDVEDAVQETLARAVAALPTLRDGRCVGGWLRTIASRCAIDQCRRSVIAVDELDDLVDEGARPEDRVLLDDDAKELHAHLAGLSDRDRGALWLRDAEGAPVADVAHFLGVTEGSARVALTRARHKLRAAYGNLVLTPLFALRDWTRRFRHPVGSETAVTAAIAQAGLAVALVVMPGSSAGGSGPGAVDLSDTVHLLASHEVATAPALSTPTDGSVVRLPAEALSAGRVTAPDSSSVEPPTMDAPWADTELGPLVVDDRPPGGTDTERVDVEDGSDVVSLTVELHLEATTPDVLADAPLQIGGTS